MKRCILFMFVGWLCFVSPAESLTSVTPGQIPDGAISEDHLDDAVKAKLNAGGGATSESEMESALTDVTDVYTDNDFTANFTNWDTAYGWGDPSGVFLPLAGGTMAGAIDLDEQGLENVYQHVVTVAKSGADYTTIQGAIDSIVDATTSKRYAILIYPGDYTETIVMEDYVDLVGHGRTNTRILGTSGTVLTYPATKGTVSDLGVVATYGALGANSVAVTSSGADSMMLRCSVTVSKSSGDFTMGSINVTDGAFRMIDSFYEYSISGATTDTALTQSAIRQSGDQTTLFIYNSDLLIESDDTNDDVVGFETTTCGTGSYVITDSIITIDATDGSSATGFWFCGSIAGGLLSKNQLTVSNPASTYGIWLDSDSGGATVNSQYNDISLDSIGAEVAYHADTGDTINVYFDSVVAASANSGGGTLNIIDSPSVGDLTATGTIEAGVLTEGGTGIYNITESDAVYEGLLVNEAGLYSALSDVSQFYESGDTIPIADGGTGQTTAQAAIDALTQVSAATDEHVLTKDTATGNAIFKASTGGITIGGSVGGGTPGSVLFVDSSSQLAQEPTNFFWDETNDALTVHNSRIHDIGSDNFFAGANAGNFTLTGSRSVGLGANSLAVFSSGYDNFCGGYNSCKSLTTGRDNVALGSDALTLAVGALGNVAIGHDSLKIGTGNYNVAIGIGSLSSTTSGSGNVAIGQFSLSSNAGGSNSTAIGALSLQFSTGANNTALGYRAGRSTTSGMQGTMIGTSSLNSNTTGIGNSGLGYNSGEAIETGGYNTVLGHNSMLYNVSGASNTAVGASALIGSSGVSVSHNVGVGYRAGKLVQGDRNIFLGSESAANLTTGDDGIFIGYDIDAQSATADDQMSIGNLLFSEGIDGAGTTVSTGGLGVGVVSPDTRLDVDGAITQRELPADPSDPDEGSSVSWLSDGTATGNDGEHLIKTTAGGSTKTLVIPFEDATILTTESLLQLTSYTSDPCGTAPEAAIFWNDTSNYPCYCDGTDDLKFSDNSACF